MTRRFDCDVIVVGSGFGGSIVAFELARSGMKVVLLERGKAYPPGSFPRDPLGMSRNFWDPSRRKYGLFDIWSFRNSEAIVSSGLGGGSLIYANVLLRKPEQWFHQTLRNKDRVAWPVSYRDLESHYSEVETMLGGTPFPTELDASCEKSAKYARASERAGYTCLRPKLAVTFKDSHDRIGCGLPLVDNKPNLHNVPRSTCRYCGECDIGCNYGSKNTLDLNYLSEAQRLGAQIRTMCEVRTLLPYKLDPTTNGYEVRYVEHDPSSKTRSRDLTEKSLFAPRVVLSAGTLGSTFLLLKNRQHLPLLSASLGSHYSTNGDILAFAMECKSKEKRPIMLNANCGPVITRATEINFGNGHGGGYIQDAGFPSFASWLAESYDISRLVPRLIRFAINRLKAWWTCDPRSEISSEISRLIGRSLLSSSSLPLLGMGCDQADGMMRLRNRRFGASPVLDVDWHPRASRLCFDSLNKACERITTELGGSYVANPLTRFLSRLITVHPLGGCPMGMNATQGVVDSYGNVFNYPGLYVADGSILPGPTGANPSLTIAAVARRVALGIVAS